MSFTTINYNSDRTGKIIYESVEVSYGDDLELVKVFDSGNFVKDWYSRTKFVITEIQTSEYHFCSSVVDHFIMDGAPYDTLWLAINGKDISLQPTYQNLSVRFFVEKGERPSWEDFRKMCEMT